MAVSPARKRGLTAFFAHVFISRQGSSSGGPPRSWSRAAEGGRKLLAHFDKNGHLFVLDRTNGQFVRAVKFGRVTWGEVDPTTRKVTVQRSPTPEGVHICPGPAGLKEWPHAAYSPRTRLLHTPVVETCGTFKLKPTEFQESMLYWGGEVELDKEQWGHVKAFDPATGRRSGGGEPSTRSSRPCSPRRETWSSPGSPTATSTRSTHEPGSCYGSSTRGAGSTAIL